MKTKDDFKKIFEELSKEQNLQYIEVKSIFIDTLCQIFNDNSVCEVEKKTHNGNINYGFFIYKNSVFKKISFSPRIKKEFTRLLNSNFIKYKNNQIKNRIKNMKKNNEIIKGEIVQIKDNHLLVKTSFAICKVPKNLLTIDDLLTIVPGNKMYFKLYKFYIKNNRLNIILTRKHPLIDKHEISIFLQNYNIKNVKRYYGKKLKIYIDKIPKQSEIENIKSIYKNEIVLFFAPKKRDKNGNAA